MKILRVTSLGYESGGAENGIVLLQSYLEKEGHVVKTFSSNAGENEKHFNDFGFKALSEQPFFLRIFYRVFYPHSFFALRKVLKEFKPDIVQVHTMYELSPSVLFLLKKHPTVLTVHGSEDFVKSYLIWSFPTSFFKSDEISEDNLNFIGKLHYWYHVHISAFVYKFALKNVDTFVVFSKYMQNVLKKDGIESVYIPNATKLFESKPISNDEFEILYVGRLESIKGVQFLIKAFTELKKDYSEITLSIVGTGSYIKILKDLVKKLFLEEDVIFYGHLNRDDLEKRYVKSSVVVIPSVWDEPFGKVGIEAMSVGRPVVASDVGGVSEWLIDRKTGYLVQPKNSNDIGKKIANLIENKELLKKMSVDSVMQAKNFSIEKHAEQILEVYKKTINNFESGKKIKRRTDLPF